MASKDLIVITGASCVRGTMELYFKQLTDAGIEFHCEDLSQLTLTGAGGNLEFKIKWIRKFAERFSDYERMIMTDAFDVTYWGSKENVVKKIPNDHVLWGAEKNCYPDSGLIERIHNPLPWKFANGGLLAGTPQAFTEWCSAAEHNHLYKPHMLDQEFLNLMLAEGSPLAKIDDQTKLFFCLYGGYDELDFASGLPINTKCCTFPNFIHANGQWNSAEMFAKYERSLQYTSADSGGR